MADFPDKEMEKLSRAIVEAILGSKDVKKALDGLQGTEDPMTKNLMVFILRLDSLAEFKNAEFSELADGEDIEDMEEPRPRLKRIRRKNEPADLIDGRLLSKNEKQFLDFLSDKFDTDSFLRDNGLKLD